jgi:hypothetical protein
MLRQAVWMVRDEVQSVNIASIHRGWIQAPQQPATCWLTFCGMTEVKSIDQANWLAWCPIIIN